MGEPSEPPRMPVMPVTVPGQDRVLVRHPEVFVAVTGVRAYPEAIMFQLLIKTCYPGGERPNLAFELPHLNQSGDFQFGAELRDGTGAWQPVAARFAGGGGGGDEGRGSFEFTFWTPVPAGSRELRLWCRWDDRGVARARADLDVERIVTASLDCRPVWST